jgi:hypothetical protein
MLSNDPNEPQASPPSDPKATGTAQTPAVLDPHSPIEVASTGTGTTNDPAGSDSRPPGVYDGDSPA